MLRVTKSRPVNLSSDADDRRMRHTTSMDRAKIPAEAPPRPWRDIVARYARPDLRAALVQLLDTALPFLALMTAIFVGLAFDVWIALILVVPAAGLLVRLFAIQHDCGHGSFFASRRANDWLGRSIGVMTLTPYGFWRRRHAAHHASSGNLDRRGAGDIDTLTVCEYRALPKWRRVMYRLYRNPVVLFGVGPAYQFFISHRIPTGRPWRDREDWLSVLGTDLMIAAAAGGLIFAVGLGPFLLGFFPVMLIAASIGIWLFYVQHQFEGTYWRADAEWDFHSAALEGCSYYDLPRVLHWVTAHLGLHHLHHLSSRIPNYRLRACFDENREFWDATRLSMLGSLACIRLALWDEELKRLVPFRALNAARS
jgi:acyl-lipid omega-6 desaturase (Delta-12 desaturase)